MPTRLAFWCAAALAAGGCASSPRLQTAPPAGQAADTAAVLAPLVRALAERATRVRTLSGRAEIALSARDWGGSTEAEAVVLAERPGRLRMRAYAGPVTAFDLVATGDRFWVYVPDRHEVWTGPAQALERRIGFPARGEDLVSALLGEPFGAPDSARLVSLDRDRAVLEWKAARGGVVRATLRRLDGAPIGYQWERDGRTVALLRCDDFVHEAAGPWPRRLFLRWSDPEASLRLTFHEQQLNRNLPPGSFEPLHPDGVDLVELSADPDSGSAWERRR